MPAKHAADDAGQLAGAGEGACGDDGARHAAALPFFAIMKKHIGNRAFIGGVDEIGGAFTLLAHPHIQRSVALKRKPALGAVELHRRHANVQRHAVNGGDSGGGEVAFHRGKRRVVEG